MVVVGGVANNTKILHVSAWTHNSGDGRWRVYDLFTGASAAAAYLLQFDATIIYFDNVGSQLQSNAYRIKIDYFI